MFWCCCGNEPVGINYVRLFATGSTDFYVNGAEAPFPGWWHSVVDFGSGMAVGKLDPPFSNNGAIPPLFQVSYLRKFLWGGVVVKVPAAVGQPITSAILRLQAGQLDPLYTPPAQPIPVRGYISRRCFTMPDVPNDQITDQDISPYPFPTPNTPPFTPNRRPWPLQNYGTTPVVWDGGPSVGTWGQVLNPWVTTTIDGFADGQAWSLDATAAIQSFINTATFDNPHCFILLCTKTNAPFQAGGISVGASRNPDPIQEKLSPNYLQLTF